MKINLANKTVQSIAFVGIAFLGLSSVPLLANNTSSQLPSVDHENVAPCWKSSPNSQTYQQHRQWMAQYGGMRGQGSHERCGWGHYSQYGRMYDPNHLVTVKGEVVSVDTFTPTRGMSGGKHLQLRTNNETWDVHLGPVWYLQNQNVQIQPNDTIEVTGSQVNLDGQPAIMATSVEKGNMTLQLRDKNGFPMWHNCSGNWFNQGN